MWQRLCHQLVNVLDGPDIAAAEPSQQWSSYTVDARIDNGFETCHWDICIPNWSTCLFCTECTQAQLLIKYHNGQFCNFMHNAA